MTETKVYDYAETLAVLNELVEEKGPGYVDQNSLHGSCLYYATDNGDRPPCLVGAFWEKLGVSDKVRRELNGYGTIDGVLVNAELPIQVTEKAFELLHKAQSSQDMGASWYVSVMRGTDSAHDQDFNDTIPQKA